MTVYNEGQMLLSVKLVEGQCGVGKTRQLFEDWKKQPNVRKVYMSHAHELLIEHSKQFEDSCHVQGLAMICPRKNNRVIKELLKFKFPHKAICSCCKELQFKPKDCPYHKQFKDMRALNTIFAPIEYAHTNYLESSMKPDVIAVDDCLLRKSDHPTPQQLESLLRHIKAMKFIDDKRFSEMTLEEFMRLPESEFENYIEKIDIALRAWIKNRVEGLKGQDKYFKFVEHHPSVFSDFRKYYKVHSEIKQYSTPYLFLLFDYINKHPDVKLVILEGLVTSTPNKTILNELIERYKIETGLQITFTISNIPAPQSAGSVVYHVRGKKEALYSNNTVKKHPKVRRQIKQSIQTILDQRHGGDKTEIGLVTFKGRGNVAGKFFEHSDEVKYSWFGKLRGKNSMESCNPFFVVGTYYRNTEKIVEEYNLWFPHRKLTTDEKDHHEGRYPFVDPVLDALRWHREDYEQYQATMRGRPLNYERQIYHFGMVPKELLPEGIEVKELRVVDGKIVEPEEDWILTQIEERKAIAVSAMVKSICEHSKVSRVTAYERIEKVKENPHVKSDERILIWRP